MTTATPQTQAEWLDEINKHWETVPIGTVLTEGMMHCNVEARALVPVAAIGRILPCCVRPRNSVSKAIAKHLFHIEPNFLISATDTSAAMNLYEEFQRSDAPFSGQVTYTIVSVADDTEVGIPIHGVTQLRTAYEWANDWEYIVGCTFDSITMRQVSTRFPFPASGTSAIQSVTYHNANGDEVEAASGEELVAPKGFVSIDTAAPFAQYQINYNFKSNIWEVSTERDHGFCIERAACKHTIGTWKWAKALAKTGLFQIYRVQSDLRKRWYPAPYPDLPVCGWVSVDTNAPGHTPGYNRLREWIPVIGDKNATDWQADAI